MPPNKELMDYVKRTKGYPKPEVAAKLRSAGYAKEDIDAAFMAAQRRKYIAPAIAAVVLIALVFIGLQLAPDTNTSGYKTALKPSAVDRCQRMASYDQGWCFFALATETGEQALCGRIAQLDLRAYCLASVKKDPSLCSSIQDGRIAEECRKASADQA
ncbi:MAG: hypothetical protein V1735_04985 [Nanoarchaeota archaeon]